MSTTKPYVNQFGFLRQASIQDVWICLHSHQFWIFIKIFHHRCASVCILSRIAVVLGLVLVKARAWEKKIAWNQNFEGMKACVSQEKQSVHANNLHAVHAVVLCGYPGYAMNYFAYSSTAHAFNHLLLF